VPHLLLSPLCSSIFTLIAVVGMFLNGPVTWRDSDQSNLVPVVVLQIVCIVPATIIPGRFSSAKAHSRLQMLSQKQAYVRFVSHEIRSPLSIVAAGLEIFVESLNEENTTPIGPNSSELLELANDLSEATDAAINILNDLLQYESMDAGMFKLEAAPVEPADLFKAKALAIIAKRHSLALNVVQPAVEDGVFVLADVYRIEQVIKWQLSCSLLSQSCCKMTMP
jgi:signal transduction histidine kinase